MGLRIAGLLPGHFRNRMEAALRCQNRCMMIAASLQVASLLVSVLAMPFIVSDPNGVGVVVFAPAVFVSCISGPCIMFGPALCGSDPCRCCTSYILRGLRDGPAK